jgi:hypothetical protein
MTLNIDFNKRKLVPGENSVFDDLTNVLGVFAASALWVIYMIYRLGPIR